MNRFTALLLALCLLLLGGLSVSQIRPLPGAAKEPFEEKWERDRQKAMNKDRQKDLKEDTDKLLALATELKNHVDKTNENMLSMDVIKKTEEIEKLAKKVREKMKADYLMPAPGLKQ
jgi:hypothetical protein